jgi:hypothetical protein
VLLLLLVNAQIRWDVWLEVSVVDVGCLLPLSFVYFKQSPLLLIVVVSSFLYDILSIMFV